MASSWNKGTLVDNADAAIDLAVASASRAVQEGKSLFQSVVDEAADKLAQGAETISEVPEIVGEAAENVGQNIPDPAGALQQGAATTGQIAAENLPDPAGALQETAQDIGDAALSGLQTATDAVAAGVNKAAAAIYEALPEKEAILSDVKMTSQAISEGVRDPEIYKEIGNNIATYNPVKLYQVFTSPVAQNFLNDLLYVQLASGQRFNPNTGEFEDFDPRQPITEDYLTDTTLDLLKKMAREKGLDGPNQSVSFEKEEVYNYLTNQGSEVKVVQTGGASAGSIIDSLSGRNPADEVKLILGAFNIKTDENGEITITDMFDYNEWYHPDTEEKWTADRFQKALEAGEVDVNELVVKSIKKYGLSYGTFRSLGFLLGSKGFEGSEYQDLLTGRKSNISLGNVSELYTSCPTPAWSSTWKGSCLRIPRSRYVGKNLDTSSRE